MSALSLAVRIARIDAVLAAIGADGAGALQLFGGGQADGPDEAPGSAPLSIIDLADPCGVSGFDGDDATLLFDLPRTGTVLASGIVTWARFVDGAGTAVLDAEVGEPGSGLPIIVDAASLFFGGDVTVLDMTFLE